MLYTHARLLIVSRRFLLAVVGAHVLIGGLRPATAASDARWFANCTVGAHTFRLVFDSPSGDVTQDDMNVTIEAHGERRVAPLPPKFYMPAAIATGASSVCDVTAALAIDEHNAMVFVSASNRPGFSILVAFAVDAADNRVFAPVAIVNSDEPVGLYGTSARVHGVEGYNPHAKSHSPDAYCFGWKRMTLKGRSIDSKWETPAPTGCKPTAPPKLQ